MELMGVMVSTCALIGHRREPLGTLVAIHQGDDGMPTALCLAALDLFANGLKTLVATWQCHKGFSGGEGASAALPLGERGQFGGRDERNVIQPDMVSAQRAWRSRPG
jgi:hypothetical protein